MANQFMQGLIDGSKLAEDQARILAELNATPSESTALTVPDNSIDDTEDTSGRWQPKEWRPEYQIICTLSSLGLSGPEIVEQMFEKYNYTITKQHVSNILNCEKGKEVRAQLLHRVVVATEDAVEKNLEEMEKLAAQRLVQLLKDDELYMKNPFAVIDRGIKVLEGRQKFKKYESVQGRNGNEQPVNQQQNNFFLNLPEDVQRRIDEGLRRSSEVNRIHGPQSESTGEVKRSGTDG